MLHGVQGIDISYANPPVDWERVKAAGISFAYVRQGYRTRTDTRWREHAEAAHKAGIPCGAYHFAYVDQDPFDEVQRFIDDGGVDGAGLVLRPVLDIEERNNAPAALVLYWARAWLDRLADRTGTLPMLYTYPAFWTGLGTEARKQSWAEFPLWIAHYGVTSPTIPAPWANYTMWQWTGTGTVDGVTGQVDRNVLADGGSLDWLQWRYPLPSPAPSPLPPPLP